MLRVSTVQDGDMSQPLIGGGKQRAQLLSIQYLRAVAALLIVYQHAREFIPVYWNHLQYFNGDCGVDIFFVISGFIMAVTARNGTARDFLLRRVTRIVPLYWFFTLLIAALLPFPNLVGNVIMTPATLLMSLLFVPHESLAHHGEIWPVLVQGWTLNYEMLFYALFATFLFLPLGKRVLTLGALFGLSVALGSHFPHIDTPVLFVVTNPILLEFVAGMVIGYLYLKRRTLPVLLAILTLVLGITILTVECFTSTPRLFIKGLTGFMIVLGVISIESRKGIPQIQFWRSLGDASYSIYLSHLFLVFLLKFVWPNSLINDSLGSALLFASANIIAAACVGALVFKGLEQPLHTLSRRFVSRMASQVPTTSNT
jgi:exopolysaccharide production protein ExoZ